MQELLELRREKKLRDEELHILRASQNECASMARDIELLQACVEQQRQHLVDVQKNREKRVDTRIGLVGLLEALSKKEKMARDRLVEQHEQQYRALWQNFTIVNQHYAQLRAQFDEATKKNEMHTQMLCMANAHLQKEISVQYSVMDDLKKTGSVTALVTRLKQAEQETAQQKLFYMQHVEAQSRNICFQIFTEHLRSLETGYSESIASMHEYYRQQMSLPRMDIVLQQVVSAAKDRQLRQQQAEIDRLQKIVDADEVSRLKKMLTGFVDTIRRTKEQCAELQQRASKADVLTVRMEKMDEMNRDLMKSRDALQIKLFNVTLENQKSANVLRDLMAANKTRDTLFATRMRAVVDEFLTKKQ